MAGGVVHNFSFFCLLLVLNVTATQQRITEHEEKTITLWCKVKFMEADAVWTFWLFNGRLMDIMLLQKALGSKPLSNAVKERDLTFPRT